MLLKRIFRNICSYQLYQKRWEAGIQAGLNQSELASLCDKDRQSIQRLEKGGMNPTAYYLLELAQALKNTS